MSADSCYDRGMTFRLKWFLNDGDSSPKIFGNRPFFCVLFVVYLGHGIFHPVVVFRFSKSDFGKGS